jgi:hypothetical protein
MNRTLNVVLVRVVLVAVALALAGLAPQTALAGWTWDEGAAASSPAAAAQPAP